MIMTFNRVDKIFETNHTSHRCNISYILVTIESKEVQVLQIWGILSKDVLCVTYVVVT